MLTTLNALNKEQLVRILTEPKNALVKQYQKLFEYDMVDLDFEPDTFGHSANLPEVLTSGGVRYYYHCRGNDSETIYRWRAPPARRCWSTGSRTGIWGRSSTASRRFCRSCAGKPGCPSC